MMYFESHITLNSKPGIDVYKDYGYKLSIFNDEIPVKKTEYIITRKGSDIKDMQAQAWSVVEALTNNGVGIKRNKLELILIDAR